MTGLGWLAWGTVAVAYVFVFWGVRADRRDYADLRADLDELAGDYHSPSDRVTALETYTGHLAEYVTEQDNHQPSTGRHAHIGEAA